MAGKGKGKEKLRQEKPIQADFLQDAHPEECQNLFENCINNRDWIVRYYDPEFPSFTDDMMKELQTKDNSRDAQLNLLRLRTFMQLLKAFSFVYLLYEFYVYRNMYKDRDDNNKLFYTENLSKLLNQVGERTQVEQGFGNRYKKIKDQLQNVGQSKQVKNAAREFHIKKLYALFSSNECNLEPCVNFIMGISEKDVAALRNDYEAFVRNANPAIDPNNQEKRFFLQDLNGFAQRALIYAAKTNMKYTNMKQTLEDYNNEYYTFNDKELDKRFRKAESYLNTVKSVAEESDSEVEISEEEEEEEEETVPLPSSEDFPEEEEEETVPLPSSEDFPEEEKEDVTDVAEFSEEEQKPGVELPEIPDIKEEIVEKPKEPEMRQPGPSQRISNNQKARFDALNQAYQELVAQNESLRRQIQESKIATTKERDQVLKERDERIEQLEVAFARANEEYDKCLFKSQTLEDDIATCNQEIAKCNEDLAECRKNETNYKNRLRTEQAINRDLEVANKRLRKAATRCENAKTQLESKEEERKSVVTQCQELQHDYDNLNDEYESLREKCGELANRCRQVKDEKEEALRQNEAIQTRLEEQIRQTDQLQAENANLQSQLETRKISAESTSECNEKLREAIREKYKLKADMSNRLQTLSDSYKKILEKYGIKSQVFYETKDDEKGVPAEVREVEMEKSGQLDIDQIMEDPNNLPDTLNNPIILRDLVRQVVTKCNEKDQMVFRNIDEFLNDLQKRFGIVLKEKESVESIWGFKDFKRIFTKKRIPLRVTGAFYKLEEGPRKYLGSKLNLLQQSGTTNVQDVVSGIFNVKDLQKLLSKVAIRLRACREAHDNMFADVRHILQNYGMTVTPVGDESKEGFFTKIKVQDAKKSDLNRRDIKEAIKTGDYNSLIEKYRHPRLKNEIIRALVVNEHRLRYASLGTASIDIDNIKLESIPKEQFDKLSIPEKYLFFEALQRRFDDLRGLVKDAEQILKAHGIQYKVAEDVYAGRQTIRVESGIPVPEREDAEKYLQADNESIQKTLQTVTDPDKYRKIIMSIVQKCREDKISTESLLERFKENIKDFLDRYGINAVVNSKTGSIELDSQTPYQTTFEMPTATVPLMGFEDTDTLDEKVREIRKDPGKINSVNYIKDLRDIVQELLKPESYETLNEKLEPYNVRVVLEDSTEGVRVEKIDPNMVPVNLEKLSQDLSNQLSPENIEITIEASSIDDSEPVVSVLRKFEGPPPSICEECEQLKEKIEDERQKLAGVAESLLKILDEKNILYEEVKDDQGDVVEYKVSTETTEERSSNGADKEYGEKYQQLCREVAKVQEPLMNLVKAFQKISVMYMNSLHIDITKLQEKQPKLYEILSQKMPDILKRKEKTLQEISERLTKLQEKTVSPVPATPMPAEPKSKRLCVGSISELFAAPYGQRSGAPSAIVTPSAEKGQKTTVQEKEGTIRAHEVVFGDAKPSVGIQKYLHEKNGYNQVSESFIKELVHVAINNVLQKFVQTVLENVKQDKIKNLDEPEYSIEIQKYYQLSSEEYAALNSAAKRGLLALMIVNNLADNIYRGCQQYNIYKNSGPAPCGTFMEKFEQEFDQLLPRLSIKCLMKNYDQCSGPACEAQYFPTGGWGEKISRVLSAGMAGKGIYAFCVQK
jgi:DNA repair exonuclease SbcCD ATPase subunit